MLGRCALGGAALVLGVLTTGSLAQGIPVSLFANLAWRCVGPFEGAAVVAVAGVPAVPGVYTVSTADGGTWTTRDAGETWSPMAPARSAPGTSATWTDPSNSRRVVRAETRGIDVSLDGGATWTALHTLPSRGVDDETAPASHAGPAAIDGHHVRVLREDPQRPGLLFAGTDDSVFVSFDAGGHWTSLELNLPSAPIRGLTVDGNDLVAAIEGYSRWRLEDITPLRQMTAATALAAATLFAPAPAANGPESRADIDYVLGPQAGGEVTLTIADETGRAIYNASSAAPGDDPWLPLAPRLSAAPGAHRVRWDLRADAPPTPANRFSHLAAALAGDPPAARGPRVPAGTYQVTLTAAGARSTQPLVVRPDPRTGDTPAFREAEQRRFELALSICQAMREAHRNERAVVPLRQQVKPLLVSNDPDLAQAASYFDAQLADIDGSDWLGFVLPDADNDADKDAVVDKDDIDEPVPSPVPVGITKDYDDPTKIIGLGYENANHPPAFATLDLQLADALSGVEGLDPAAVGQSAEAASLGRLRDQLTAVEQAWQAIAGATLPAFNRELTSRHLPPLTIRPPAGTAPPGRRSRVR